MTKTTVWADLSEDASSVLEWIESPYTGRQAPLGVCVGEYPTIGGHPRNLIGRVVDEALFREIADYVVAHSEDFLESSIMDDRLVVSGIRPMPAPPFGTSTPTP
jgi:hypothetical protein